MKQELPMLGQIWRQKKLINGKEFGDPKVLARIKDIKDGRIYYDIGSDKSDNDHVSLTFFTSLLSIADCELDTFTIIYELHPNSPQIV